MNQTLVGVIGTLVTLGSIGVMAGNDKAPAQPPAAQVQGNLTPEQLEALQRTVQAMNPGSKVQVEVVHKDGGTVHTYEEGTGKGASAEAEGDKLSDKITGDAPVVNRGADGSASAKGGDVERNTSGSATKVPLLPWANPLFWIGVGCLGGCGFGVYSGLRRLALILGVAGVGCLAAAFYPALLLWAVAAVLVVLVGPYVYAEWKKRKAEKDDEESWEALRAVVAGVEGKGVSAEARAQVKAAIAKEADARDKQTIDEVKRMDSIGKYAD